MIATMDNYFDFGRNWEYFSSIRLNEHRLISAVESLSSMLSDQDICGKSFLDVGCGSGIFSIAAQSLGASHVVGIDVNPKCISVSLGNRYRLAPEAPIQFLLGSALNIADLVQLGKFDVVYAWGSLHHTGDMWTSIKNVSETVSDGGVFILSIYNQHFTSPIWRYIKWFYNQVPVIIKRMMIFIFSGIIFISKLLITRRNPLIKQRGMDFWFDVIDWIGGYPYEYSSPENIITFVTNLGFIMHEFIPSEVPTGCNEFVFRRV